MNRISSVPISLAAIQAELPEWAETALPWLGAALAALAALWIVATAAARIHARAYNLTRVETARPSKEVKPAFLTVDEEAREAAVARGDAYVRPGDRQSSAAEETETNAVANRWWRWGTIARAGALIVAIVHLGVVALSALTVADRAREQLESFEAARAVLAAYPVGSFLAVAVVLVEVTRFVRRRR